MNDPLTNAEEKARAERIEKCVAFCEGVPTENIPPAGTLLKSFRPLVNGDVTEVLTLAEENKQLRLAVASKQLVIDTLRGHLERIEKLLGRMQ